MREHRALAVAVATAAVAGCPDRPRPVLFRSGVDARVIAPADVVALDAGSDVPTFATRTGVSFDGGTAALTVGTETLAAAEGERFGASIELDLDADRATDAVIATRLRSDGTAAGLAWWRREGGRLSAVPWQSGAPIEPRCVDATLRQSGQHSVSVTWRCPSGVAAGAEAWLVALGPAAPRVWFRASLRPEAVPDTALELTLDGVDRDGDGSDEAVLTLGAGAPGASVGARAKVVYFERAGTPARDTSEPAASLRVLGDELRRLATLRRTSAAVALGRIDDALRLRRAICAGSPLVALRLPGGDGLSCEATLTSLPELRARAYATLGEVPAALAALRPEGADELGPAPARIEAELRRAAAAERGSVGRAGPFGASALDAMAPLRIGALRFEGGALSLRGPATGRVELAAMTFAAGPPGTADEIRPRSPDGQWVAIGAAAGCHGPAVALCPRDAADCVAATPAPGSTVLPAGAVFHPLPELLSLDMAQRCLRDAAAVQWLPASELAALGWNAQGLLVARHGRLYRVSRERPVAERVLSGAALGSGFVAGSSVNPGGTTLALGRTEGLWLRDRGTWKLLAPTGLEGRTGQLADLAVSDDGRTVGALLGTQIWVVQRATTRR